MATTNTYATLNEILRTRYGDLNDVIPDSAVLLKRIPYTQKMGKDYRVPVVLGNEGGVTFAGPEDDAVTLNASIAMAVKEAIVQPYQTHFRGQIGQNIIDRTNGDKNAAVNAVDKLIKSMLFSITKNVEISMVYGQTNLGIVTAYSNVSATSTTLTFTDATWAPRIWVESENHKIDFYDVEYDSLINAAAATISSISIDNKTITITAASGDITLIQNAISNTGAGLKVYWYGARSGETYKECAGLDKIATNTGTLFGINASTYNMWKGNTYNVGGALTLAKFNAAVVNACNKGLDGDATFLVSPKTWSNIMSDQAALRSYDASYSENGKNGFKALKFYSQNGTNEIIPYGILKEGEAFLLPFGEFERVGASDITFNDQVTGEKKFFALEGVTAFELRAHSNQALFCNAPAKVTKLYGIVNS